MKPTITVVLLAAAALFLPSDLAAEFRAGAAVVDVSPPAFPVLVNGGMLSRTASGINTRVNARAIVLDDGNERLGIVVVDSCMMPRDLLDEAKQLAAKRTKIRPDRILISATHTHTAPASMGCLGTDADPGYVSYLRLRLAEALAAAEANLEPARVGWATANAAQFTAVRRWIRRPDMLADDPFGNPTVRATMHAGADWNVGVGESGPEDPELSLISFQASDGRPIALLANFSMHYYSGQRPISADYFGLFCEGLQEKIAKKDQQPSFVAAMSHGCSGDIWRRDYTQPEFNKEIHTNIDAYAAGLVDIALKAYEGIEYNSDVDLAMAEARLKLNYRVPDKQRLEWARRIVAEMGERPPKSQPEVYAREQIILHERQSTEIVLQALRIGDIAITTTPNETYALTGLKLKLQSPLRKTMTIELANGGDGYIPPPEQHLLGGYNTWPARSAGLEVQAEPKIVETDLQLLEKVTGRPRRDYRQTRGPASKALAAAKPLAWWRLDEFAGPRALDSSGRRRDAIYEPAVAYFLEGPRSKSFCEGDETNRAAHFAGGRLRARCDDLGENYSVSLWFWNGMPHDGRDVTGWMLSRGREHRLGPHGDHLGLGGTATEPGKLIYLSGADAKPVVGRTALERWTWNHALFVREGNNVRVYLNGNPQPEISTESDAAGAARLDRLFFGGRCDNQANWEGRLDEIALFDRALSEKEIEKLSAPAARASAASSN